MSQTHQLKDFQEKAVRSIGNELAEALSESGTQREAKIVLHSPTGSGKTRMIAEIIKDYLFNAMVLVLSPGKGNLQQQTQDSLSASLAHDSRVCVKDMTLENLAMDPQPGTVYVANWERLTTQNKQRDYTVRLTRSSESSNLFDHVAKCGADIPVVVIIDEAHYGASKNARKIQGFLKDLADTVKKSGGEELITLEASATPLEIVGKTPRKVYRVETDDVIDAGLNRVAGVWNADIDNKVLVEEESKAQALDAQKPPEIQKMSKAVYADVEELILDKANDKRKHLNAQMKIAGSGYRVLLAVQIPNSNLGVEAQTRVLDYFERQGITIENGRLAIITATTKAGEVDGLSSPDSPVDVLIYKQALDTGWNCPRAQILVGFRHIKSEVFSLQNIGRFRRTTEGYHYDNPELNKFYIYSNTTNSLHEYISRQKGVTLDASGVELNFTADKDKLDLMNSYKLPVSRWKKVSQKPISHSVLGRALNKVVDTNKSFVEIPFEEPFGVSLRTIDNIDTGKFDTEDALKSLGEAGRVVYSGTKESRSRLKFEFLNIVKTAIVSTGDYGNNAKVAETLAPLIVSFYANRVWRKEHGGIDDSKRRESSEVIGSFLASTENRETLSRLVSTLMSTSDVQAYANREEKEGEVIPSFYRTLTIVDEFEFAPSMHVKEDADKIVPHEFYGATLYGRTTESQQRISQWQESLSKPERLFQNQLIEFLNNNPKYALKVIHKNPPQSNGKNFSVGLKIQVKDEKGRDAVTNFFPDYLLVLENTATGTSFPVIVEVKDCTLEGRSQDRYVKNKARAAETYAERTGVPFYLVGTGDAGSVILDNNANNTACDFFTKMKESLDAGLHVEKALVSADKTWMHNLGNLREKFSPLE